MSQRNERFGCVLSEFHMKWHQSIYDSEIHINKQCLWLNEVWTHLLNKICILSIVSHVIWDFTFLSQSSDKSVATKNFVTNNWKKMWKYLTKSCLITIREISSFFCYWVFSRFEWNFFQEDSNRQLIFNQKTFSFFCWDCHFMFCL